MKVGDVVCIDNFVVLILEIDITDEVINPCGEEPRYKICKGACFYHGELPIMREYYQNILESNYGIL